MRVYRYFGKPKHPLEPAGGWLTLEEAFEASCLVAGRRRTVQVTRKYVHTGPKKTPKPQVPTLDMEVTAGHGQATAGEKGARYGYAEVVVTPTNPGYCKQAMKRLERLATALRKLPCVSAVSPGTLPGGCRLLVLGPYEAGQAAWFPSFQEALVDLAPKFGLRVTKTVETPKGSVWLWTRRYRRRGR